ncbi:MAG: hypothetical protein KKE23_00800, partial [Nanoarchaeota archaeon]|nr:hypothetical protein [Nanoarchaeota archaeon]
PIQGAAVYSSYTGFAIKDIPKDIPQINVQSSQYYGSLYYFPVRQKTKAHSTDYSDALSNWWKAQGSWNRYLKRHFATMGLGMLKGFLLNTILGQKFAERWNMLSAQFWISKGVCAALWPSTSATALWKIGDICNEKFNKALLPILTCSIQTYVNGRVLSNNVCFPVTAQEMSVPTGFGNCEKCQDDAFPCTAQRCSALSADSSCVHDPYAQKCWPNPEKLKACDKTSGTPLKITQINNVSITPSNQYSKTGILYADLSFNVELNTNIAAECRYTLNKSAGWSGMTAMNVDRSYKTFTASVDVSDPLKKTNYYYVLCQDTCRKQIFSQIVEMKLEKADKPDIEGPVIIEKYPLPDFPIEGGLNNRREISLLVKTDEPAECKYKRWPVAESMDSFVGSLNDIERVASTLVGAGASEQTLESELSLTGLDYDSVNLTIMGPGRDQFALEHYVNFIGSESLNNNEIYAFVVLCKDKTGNIGEIPGVIRFKVSQPFKVTINEPRDTTMEPQPEIEVSTDRSSACGYGIDVKPVYTNMTSFENTGFSQHSTTIERILSYGQHKLYVTCFDSDKLDISSAERTFNLLRDNRAPQIVRAYKDADTLFIATNELTSCQYSIKQFTYGQGSDMTENYPNSKTHRMDWRADTTYYIKCKDRFGNEKADTLRTTKSEEALL